VRFPRFLAHPSTLGRLGAVLTVFWAGVALAGSFVQVQVLLPGETAAPGTVSGKTGTPDAQVTGVPFDVVVRACDSGWYTVASASDVIRLTSTAGSAVLPAPSVLIGGTATFQVILPSSGTARFTAQDQTNLMIPLGSSTNMSAVALMGFRFQDAAPHERAAGVPFATSLTAIDASGNVVLGYHGPVALEQLTSQGLGRVEPATINLASGVWSGTLTVFRADTANQPAGAARVHAHLPGDPGRSGTCDPFIVNAGAFTRLQLLAPGMTAVPGSVTGFEGAPASQSAMATFQVSARATDTWWNPVSSSHQVRLVSSDSWATTPLTMTLASGFAQASVALATTGGQTLTVYDLNDPTITTMVSPVIPVTAAAASHFQFSTLPSGATAGQPITMTIRAVDAGGTTITTFDGNARLSATTGAATMSPEQVTFTDGVWTGPVTLFGAAVGTTVTCQDYAMPPHQGTSDAVNVGPGAWTGLQVLLPGQVAVPGTSAGITGEPEPQSAGQALAISVRAVDDWFNLVPGATGALQLTGSDPSLAIAGAPVLSGGAASVTITPYLAGAQDLTCAVPTAPAVDAGHSAEYLVSAGPFTKLLLTLPGQAPLPGAAEGRNGAAEDQSITFGFAAVVRATDDWFNPLSSASDLIQLACSDPAAQVGGPLSMVNGTATFTVRLSTGGYQMLTATNLTRPAMATSATQVRAISSGLHLTAAIAQESTQAGSPFTLEVTARNDAGSIIQECNAQVTVVAVGAHDQSPARGALSSTTFQLLQGRRTVNLSYTYAEDVVLRISDDAGSTPAVTGALQVVPGDPAVLELTGDPEWVRPGRSIDLTARLTDAWGNGVPHQSVTFAVAAADSGMLAPGQGKAVSVATGTGGLAAAQYQAPGFAQQFTVTAACGGLSAGCDVVTAEIDPAAAAGTLTNYPNPFHPGEGPTTIAWKLDAASEVRLRIYTISGGLVLDRRFEAGGPGGSVGDNEFEWDGKNGDGIDVASGGYVLRVEAQGSGTTQHVMRRKVGVVW
jgi:hypothetical protein